ncbi:hypothetical protein [Commensalibacter oyaizuii]|uniref:Uncharacterized protein n=1 Tax=Commensalibacter oyaizuii TaxID=3043873 RepID=A0ABT6Q3I2_9PROT|nr:hypothetical protein [Commensalibacter sp. TBRC 16381]MDI2091684.1 hypothetical protein [Commensalibacter sp. TBRC 16381]
MARRTTDIKITEPGRDQGKLFKITEMSAFDTEEWAEKTINAVLRNVDRKDLLLLLPVVYTYIQDLSENKTVEQVIEEKGEGKATISQATEYLSIYFSSLVFQLPFDALKQIMEPLLNCCSIYLSPGQTELTEPVSNNFSQYIEEPSTIFALKREAFKLHTDFFIKGSRPHLAQLISTINQTIENQKSDTPQTSPKP